LYVRGLQNVHKKLLIQAAACNLALLMRTLHGAGKPRAAHDRRRELILAILRLYSALTASCGQASISSRDPRSVRHRSPCRRQETFRASKKVV
jgi:hypothetical protein